MFKLEICYTSQQMFENPSQLYCTLQLVCEDCVLFVCVDLHVSFWGSSTQIASQQVGSCIHLSFVNFALHPPPQTNI